MENQKIRTERTVCDFCGEENAVLYCGSDSAKLCLICDHHVHSANALSRKHLRSQLCDNCSSVPVSVRCSTDNLVLCQECDWDAHGSCSVSIQHERQAVEGFSGCPSAQELASIWGFDLSDKSLLLPQFSQNESDLDSIFGFFIRERSTYDNSRNPNVSGRFGADSTDSWLPKTAVNLDDLIVPAENLRSYLNVPCAKIPSLSKHQNPTCGKRKQVIFQQLIELLKKDLTPKNNATVLEPSCNLSPSTPNQNGQLRSLKSPDLRDGGGDQVVDADPFDRPLLQNPYSSLLMLPEHPDFGDNCLVEDDIFWDCSALDQANEIWDFHSRKFRNQGEHAPVEVGYGTDDSNFRVKCYNGLMEETSLVTAEVLEDIYDLNHPLTHQDISLTDIQHISPQDPDIKRLTSTWRNSSNNQASLGPLLIKGDILETATKVDSELLAYNRECDVALQGEKENTQANTTTILSNWTCGGCRFDKNIRYESRKARAGTRKRANGRFVKAGEGVGIEISS